jgi:hypothetical protein
MLLMRVAFSVLTSNPDPSNQQHCEHESSDLQEDPVLRYPFTESGPLHVWLSVHVAGTCLLWVIFIASSGHN